MLVIVKICKKWRHYIKNVKYFIQMIIDHVNFKNFFINKTFNRKKTRWWKKLAKFDLKIKYRFDKNNFANDSSRKRDYENETAKKNKNNENLNFKEWILIESKSIFKNKNEKKKKRIHTSFNWLIIDTQFCQMQTTIHQKFSKQSTRRRKAIVSRKIISKKAQRSQSLKTHKTFWRRKKSLRLWKEFWKKKNFKSSSRDTEEISRKLRLENVANNEELASKDWIKNVSNKKTTFNASFLKFRIVLFILQQFDSFAQRIRFFVEKVSMKHDKKNKSEKRFNFDENDDLTSNKNRKNVNFDSSFKWNIENDLLCWKNKWYIFFKIFQKRIFEAKSWWFVRWLFRARKNARFVKKKILLKQHKQRRQRIRRHLFDMSSS
jgi:hypothetical protein